MTFAGFGIIIVREVIPEQYLISLNIVEMSAEADKRCKNET